MAFVYILKSKNYDKTYVGSTLNLEKRLSEHNSGKSTFTSKFKPWTIIYSEDFQNLSEARKKEKYYKSASGRNQIKKLNIPR
jgi:putative endonuclease